MVVGIFGMAIRPTAFGKMNKIRQTSTGLALEGPNRWTMFYIGLKFTHRTLKSTKTTM